MASATIKAYNELQNSKGREIVIEKRFDDFTRLIRNAVIEELNKNPDIDVVEFFALLTSYFDEITSQIKVWCVLLNCSCCL